MFANAGFICITSFISPFEADRNLARKAAGHNIFIEVFIKASLDICEQRDPKGLYHKACAGELKELTGIDSPYEEPKFPDLTIETDLIDSATAAALLAKNI